MENKERVIKIKKHSHHKKGPPKKKPNNCHCNRPEIERQVNTPDTGTVQSETSLAYFKNLILYGFNDLNGNPNNSSGFAFSNNLGETWIDGGLIPLRAGGRNLGDPVIAVDRNGIFYYGQIGGEVRDGRLEGIISVSTGTFNAAGTITMGLPQLVGRGQNPAISNPGDQDKEWIAVGPDKNNPGNEALYVVWRDDTSNTSIRFSKYSTGQNLTELIGSNTIVAGGADGNSGAFVVIDDSGNIYVFYETFPNNLTQFNQLGVSNRSIRMAKSTDGGNNFIDVPVSLPFAAAATTVTPCNRPSIGVDNARQIRMNEFPHASIGPDGTLYVVWNAGTVVGTTTFINVFLAYSQDGGNSWNQVNITNNVSFPFFPSVTANCKGAHIQYNRFNDPNNVGNTGNGTFGIFMKTFSLNTGLSPERVISNPSSQVPITNTFGCYMGDYNQIISGPGSCLLHSWGDNRNIVSGQPNPDVFFALTSS
ncbi:sialidase family protein [Priestia megaterium]|uniref:sialidase family protein n=1 Tax=Priestia megaterium TaxID=1404 RepID=UPI003D08B84D